jgi:hypothetical protein
MATVSACYVPSARTACSLGCGHVAYWCMQGSEARAQVISHHGDPFGLHSASMAAAAAAQQQALKRPRLQMSQQPLLQQQGLSAGLMQQQLAAAVSMGPSAAALQPLQQLQAYTAAGLSLPAASALPPVSMGVPGPAGLPALTSAGSTAAALQQLPARYASCLATGKVHGPYGMHT